MRIPRIYINRPLVVETEIEIDGQVAHYLAKVLRMESGRLITLFNGEDVEYSAEIKSVSKRSLTAYIKNCAEISRESSLSTELAIGVSRGDRMDHVLQKSVELGITHITPLFTERTEVKLKGERLEKKLEHWQQIIISASEQCQRNTLATLNKPVNIQQYLDECPAELKLVLHHRSDKKLSDYETPNSTCLLVGPEGGLSETEIESALNAGFSALTLGPRVLRTETAPLAALSVIQFAWGDLSK